MPKPRSGPEGERRSHRATLCDLRKEADWHLALCGRRKTDRYLALRTGRSDKPDRSLALRRCGRPEADRDLALKTNRKLALSLERIVEARNVCGWVEQRR